MKISRIFFVLLLLCAALVCAGCTQPVPQERVTNGTAITTMTDPAELGLAPSDLPQGYTLAESRTKNISEMSRLALNLGWDGGQVVSYTSSPQDGKPGYSIVHTIAVYPARTMTEVIDFSDRQARADTAFTYTDIPVPGPGVNARAFSGKTGPVIPVTTLKENSLVTGIDNQDTRTGEKGNFSMIIFAKGNIFEVIKITGPSPDTALLMNLSKTAYAKIP